MAVGGSCTTALQHCQEVPQKGFEKGSNRLKAKKQIQKQALCGPCSAWRVFDQVSKEEEVLKGCCALASLQASGGTNPHTRLSLGTGVIFILLPMFLLNRSLVTAMAKHTLSFHLNTFQREQICVIWQQFYQVSVFYKGFYFLLFCRFLYNGYFFWKCFCVHSICTVGIASINCMTSTARKDKS